MRWRDGRRCASFDGLSHNGPLTENTTTMIHNWRPPGKRSEDWRGAVVGGVALVGAVLAIVKGGWPALVPFGLAGTVVIVFLGYLRWLSRPDL